MNQKWTVTVTSTVLMQHLFAHMMLIVASANPINLHELERKVMIFIKIDYLIFDLYNIMCTGSTTYQKRCVRIKHDNCILLLW